jgi:hypothetical protein
MRRRDRRAATHRWSHIRFSIAFEVLYDDASIDDGHSYALFASIVDGDSVYQSIEPVPSSRADRKSTSSYPSPRRRWENQARWDDRPIRTTLSCPSPPSRPAALVKEDTGTVVSVATIQKVPSIGDVRSRSGTTPELIDPAARYVVRAAIVDGGAVWDTGGTATRRWHRRRHAGRVPRSGRRAEIGGIPIPPTPTACPDRRTGPRRPQRSRPRRRRRRPTQAPTEAPTEAPTVRRSRRPRRSHRRADGRPPTPTPKPTATAEAHAESDTFAEPDSESEPKSDTESEPESDTVASRRRVRRPARAVPRPRRHPPQPARSPHADVRGAGAAVATARALVVLVEGAGKASAGPSSRAR